MPCARIARVAHPGNHPDAFSNYRDWRAFLTALTAVQVPAAAYASLATSLKAGHGWLTGLVTRETPGV
jgi:hypothetical protein